MHVNFFLKMCQRALQELGARFEALINQQRFGLPVYLLCRKEMIKSLERERDKIKVVDHPHILIFHCYSLRF